MTLPWTFGKLFTYIVFCKVVINIGKGIDIMALKRSRNTFCKNILFLTRKKNAIIKEVSPMFTLEVCVCTYRKKGVQVSFCGVDIGLGQVSKE